MEQEGGWDQGRNKALNASKTMPGSWRNTPAHLLSIDT